MKAIILAGGTLDLKDPLFPLTLGQPKALLQLGGKTMIEFVLQALQNSRLIDEIVIVGQRSSTASSGPKPVGGIPDQGSLVANGLAGMEWATRSTLTPDSHQSTLDDYVLYCSVDIPAIKTEIIDELVDLCHPLKSSIYYFFVTQETMENRFPGSRRTYARLREGRVAGGDMLLVKIGSVEHYKTVLIELEERRKQPWRLAQLIGYQTLLKYLTGRLGIVDLESIAGEILNVPVKVVLSPHAEIAMDVDKPAQLELLRKYLA